MLGNNPLKIRLFLAARTILIRLSNGWLINNFTDATQLEEIYPIPLFARSCDIILYDITIYFYLCASGGMHSFQTIPLVLVSASTPRLTLFHPPHRRRSSTPTLQVSISIHVASILYFPSSSVYPPFLSVCFAEAALLHFPLTRWENPRREFYTDCLALSHLGSHLLRILCAPYGNYRASAGEAKKKEGRCTFRIRCIRLSVAENNARCLANVCEPWRFAPRIMLSTTYALRSATSAKSRREFYCAAIPVMRDKLGSS